MNDDYLRSIWKNFDETFIHDCLEEIYKKQGYQVKNFHKDDRVNEKGTDLECKKGNESIGIAVKKKPVKKDILQLKELSKNSVDKKIYVYSAPPTRPFENETEKHENIIFWDWIKLHEELVKYASKKYIIAYFSVHPLISNLFKIYQILYDCHDIAHIDHKPKYDEMEAIWNFKDDAVKLKATLDFIKDRWNKILMDKTESNTDENQELLQNIHIELQNINSKFGNSLFNTFEKLRDKYPNLLGNYWRLVSEITNWKNFTSKSIKFGRKNRRELDHYILFDWILPDPENGKYSYVMRGFYSILYYIIENTFEISKDIEDGVDWLFDSLDFKE